MKKYLAVLLCAIMLISALTGCANDTPAAADKKDSVVVYICDIYCTMNPYLNPVWQNLGKLVMMH